MSETDPALDLDAEDSDWHNANGEMPDYGSLAALQLAHRVVAKFPDLARRYQKFIGTAAVVSSVVVVLASIAVSRRMHKGESPESILASITPEEIESIAREKPIKPPKPTPAGRRRLGRFLH